MSDDTLTFDDLRERGCICRVPPLHPETGAVINRDCPVHGLD
ncbi:hypothetical protein FHS23_004610 [Prauserella isguenensis]|uniref:Uncharacterized protein n=1 Tax=Prauserella isguenensis TaxID=1470180 RepID=A0A839S6Y8_9PSEU|nr:hypothetical protein [Prauserella isguenensis]MBB3053556.1 hypothetical protein [Prauserella isguenensis]